MFSGILMHASLKGDDAYTHRMQNQCSEVIFCIVEYNLAILSTWYFDDAQFYCCQIRMIEAWRKTGEQNDEQINRHIFNSPTCLTFMFLFVYTTVEWSWLLPSIVCSAGWIGERKFKSRNGLRFVARLCKCTHRLHKNPLSQFYSSHSFVNSNHIWGQIFCLRHIQHACDHRDVIRLSKLRAQSMTKIASARAMINRWIRME